MRTLIIDNYDSFTYNLFHCLAGATGRDPVVIRNDDPRWHRGMLDGFDAVVLSPGPGNPSVDADFGICREVVAHADLPLLGVCLGHQGLSLWHGATVGRAPEPRHGRVSPVLHGGTGLFQGLPSPFDVVRYHSLTVTDLPDELEPTAWTPDGILMAVAHRQRPMWGLQFHPESILTRHGKDLLVNFARLAADRRADRDRTVPAPRRSAARPPAAPDTGACTAPRRTLRVLVERTADRPGPGGGLRRAVPGQRPLLLAGQRPTGRAGQRAVLVHGGRLRAARPGGHARTVASGTVTVHSRRRHRGRPRRLPRLAGRGPARGPDTRVAGRCPSSSRSAGSATSATS